MKPISIAAVQLWSTPDRTAEQNREHAIEMVRMAATKSTDLVLLPEAVAMLCMPDDKTDFTYHDASESLPGPTSVALCEVARTTNTNIVAGIIHDRGDECQNLAIVIDRSGTVVGTYEKVHEPEVCRLEQGAATGAEVPVFDLDIGRIGIMICWDIISPEVSSILGLKGAELILFPHLIGLPSTSNFSVQIRSRAIDTGVPIVAAGMRDNSTHTGAQDGLYPTCAIAADGTILDQIDTAGADILRLSLTLSDESGGAARVRHARRDRLPEVYAKEYCALGKRS